MKKLLTLLVVASFSVNVNAQQKNQPSVKELLQRAQKVTLHERDAQSQTLKIKEKPIKTKQSFKPSVKSLGDWASYYYDADSLVYPFGTYDSFSVAIRYSPSDLNSLGFGGRTLSKVRFVPNEAGCTYTVKVWTGGTATAPGTLEVSETLNSSTLVINEWNTIALTTPVTINASQELWIGISYSAISGYPAGIDGGPAVRGKGNLFYGNGVWSDIAELDSRLDFNWAIAAYIAVDTNAPEAPLNFTATPDAGGALSCVLNWTNPSLTANGDPLTNLTSIVISRDGMPLHTVTSPVIGAADTWTDNTPTSGNHVYSIYATNSSGNSSFVSQTAYTGINPCSIAISNFPYTESFEDNNTPDCWQMNYVTGRKAWSTLMGDVCGAYTGAHSGDKNAVFFNEDFVTETTKFIMPKMDITSLTTPVLKFWHGQFGLGESQDSLKIFYKTSETGAWTLLEKYTNHIPMWREELILLPNASNEYYIAFEGTANSGCGVVLDDVRVEGLPALDAGVTKIDRPATGLLSGNETVKVTIKNMGSNTLTSVPVAVEVNGVVVANETITASIASLTEYTYTFTTTINLSAEQTYNIKAYTSLLDDGNTTNDTLVKKVINCGNTAIMGMTPSMTTCDIRFVDDGIDNSYLTTSERLQQMTFYPSEPDKKLMVTFNDLSTLPFSSETGYDVLVVYNGSLNDDGTEREIGFEGEYRDSLPISIVSENADGSLKFVFLKAGTYSNRTMRGWDAQITCVNPGTIDAEVVKVATPVNGVLSNAETITVTVRNFGTEPLNNIPVICTINGTALPTANITGPLAPYTSTIKTFTADLSVRGNYVIKAYTQVSGDQNPNNDTAVTTVICTPPVAITWDFEQGMPNNFMLKKMDNNIVYSELTPYFPNNEAWQIFQGSEILGRMPIGTKCAISASCFTTSLAANRWMITPKIIVGANAMLQWDASVAKTNSADGYAVKISTTDTNPASFTTTLFSTNAEKSTWENHVIDLSAYDGQSVYIAFVQNSTEKYFIMIDDIKLLGNATLGISSISQDKSNIQIYPNPATDNITVKGANGFTIKIVDISGKIVVNSKALKDKETIDIGKLKQGVYIIDLQSKDTKVTRKLLKK